MALNKEFFDNLDKLEKYKSNLNLKDFFDAINTLEELGEKMEGKSTAKASRLNKQALDLTKELEEKKNEIAMRTKTQKEFDAVYECIDYLEKHFN